jgi:hypothetical protein
LLWFPPFKKIFLNKLIGKKRPNTKYFHYSKF